MVVAEVLKGSLLRLVLVVIVSCVLSLVEFAVAKGCFVRRGGLEKKAFGLSLSFWL